MNQRTRRYIAVPRAYFYLAPLLLFIAAFILVPVIGTAFNALFRDITFLPRKFVGLENFVHLLHDHRFWISMRFTLLFTLVSVPLELLFGCIFALVLNESFPGRGVLRACILIPWAIPAAISARAWELIYNFNYGAANRLVQTLHLTDGPVNWLGSPIGAFCAVVAADVWKTTPFVAIILLAGLSALPEDLYRQARIDGTTFIQRFFSITVPLIRPVLIVALLFRTIDTLRVFDLLYVLTHGGPGGSTSSLSLYGYKYFLSGDYGYGSAVSIVLFLIALGLSVAYVGAGRFGGDLK